MTGTTTRTSLAGRIAGSAVALLGAYQIGLGIYFGFVRPPLLPEDARFIGQPLPANLEPWLDFVFNVMGGQMAALGVLTIALALRYFGSSSRGPFQIVSLALAGLSSAGVMSLTNFALEPDFKWILLAPVGLWTVAIAFAALSQKPRRVASR